ncbi:porin [Vibrio sp. CyArs1]|uniref:porin n=1 Tax=Vibrio sp. CyArs1 TaxID=2682577 RepID=UPI001F070573|nr:porin [Vibrio sp. CyArs1]
MKKTLVALAVLAAGSAQAGIEIYNQDKVTVNLKGDIEVVYLQGIGVDQEMEQQIQDADFGFDVRYALNDDLQFGGYWEFDGASSDVTKGENKNALVGNTYVAVYSATYGSVKFGRLDSVLDDAGIGSDYQFGFDAFFSNESPFGADESVRYDLDKGNFYGALAYKQDKNDDAGLGTDGNMVDAKLGARFADFDVRAFYGKATFKGVIDGTAVSGSTDETLYALEAGWAGVENLNIEAGYYNLNNQADKTTNIYGLAADYTIDKVVLAAGLQYATFDKETYTSADGSTDTADSTTGWFLNAGYKIAPSATVYAEVGGNNGYSKDANNNYKTNDVGFALGAKAEF